MLCSCVDFQIGIYNVWQSVDSCVPRLFSPVSPAIFPFLCLTMIFCTQCVDAFLLIVLSIGLLLLVHRKNAGKFIEQLLSIDSLHKFIFNDEFCSLPNFWVLSIGKCPKLSRKTWKQVNSTICLKSIWNTWSHAFLDWLAPNDSIFNAIFSEAKLIVGGN